MRTTGLVLWTVTGLGLWCGAELEGPRQVEAHEKCEGMVWPERWIPERPEDLSTGARGREAKVRRWVGSACG